MADPIKSKKMLFMMRKKTWNNQDKKSLESNREPANLNSVPFAQIEPWTIWWKANAFTKEPAILHPK